MTKKEKRMAALAVATSAAAMLALVDASRVRAREGEMKAEVAKHYRAYLENRSTAGGRVAEAEAKRMAAEAESEEDRKRAWAALDAARRSEIEGKKERGQAEFEKTLAISRAKASEEEARQARELAARAEAQVESLREQAAKAARRVVEVEGAYRLLAAERNSIAARLDAALKTPSQAAPRLVYVPPLQVYDDWDDRRAEEEHRREMEDAAQIQTIEMQRMNAELHQINSRLRWDW